MVGDDQVDVEGHRFGQDRVGKVDGKQGATDIFLIGVAEQKPGVVPRFGQRGGGEGLERTNDIPKWVSS